MKLDAAGGLAPTNLFEAAILRQAVQPQCDEGHSTAFQPHGLWWLFHRRRWDDDLSVIKPRFWCRECWRTRQFKRPPTAITLIVETTEAFKLPMPPDHEWQTAVRAAR